MNWVKEGNATAVYSHIFSRINIKTIVNQKVTWFIQFEILVEE